MLSSTLSTSQVPNVLTGQEMLVIASKVDICICVLHIVSRIRMYRGTYSVVNVTQCLLYSWIKHFLLSLIKYDHTMLRTENLRSI